MLVVGVVFAADWPQWRGPGRTGRSAEVGLLKQWPEGGPKKLWTINGLGEGYSSISVKDGRIYTMGTSDGGETLFALDFKTGKVLWQKKSSDGVFQQGQGNGPRCTPTADGDRLYTEDAHGVVSCWKAADGERVWQIKLTDFGGKVPRWGYSESPLIDGDAVFVTPGGPKGTILRLDKMTGKVKWQSTDAKHVTAYSSCIVVTVDGKKQIINNTGTGPPAAAAPAPAPREGGRRRRRRRGGRVGTMIGVDAETGKLLWKSSAGVATLACCTPIFHDGIVVASSGYGQGTGAVKLSANGAEQLWKIDRQGSHHGGVIRVGDYLYGFINQITCIELKTGKIKWQNRSVGKGSLTYADGMLFCLGEKNTVGLVAATPDGYNEKGRFSIPKSGKPSWTHPVVVNGRLFIRDQDSLTCYDVKGE